MIVDTTINTYIDTLLSKENFDERENHISSNKLTASYLKEPKRFQLLKYLGVPTKEVDCYSLRKFARGRQVEDYFIGKLKDSGLVVETQKSLEYRGCIGIVDATMDSDKMQFHKGIIPHEIKSVTNRAYKWIHDRGDIGWGYHLQACLYAMALETEYYALDFIASDDLREYITIHETRIFKKEVDRVISEYQQMIQDFTTNATVPKWETHDKWQNDPKYMKYDVFWSECSDTQFINKLQELGI
jgi:hypothetical protein